MNKKKIWDNDWYYGDYNSIVNHSPCCFDKTKSNTVGSDAKRLQNL